MNYAHDGFYKCFGDDLSSSIKNVIKNNQYKNLESVLSIQDLGKQKGKKVNFIFISGIKILLYLQIIIWAV